MPPHFPACFVYNRCWGHSPLVVIFITVSIPRPFAFRRAFLTLQLASVLHQFPYSGRVTVWLAIFGPICVRSLQAMQAREPLALTHHPRCVDVFHV